MAVLPMSCSSAAMRVHATSSARQPEPRRRRGGELGDVDHVPCEILALLDDHLHERIAHLQALAHLRRALVGVEPLVGELERPLERCRLRGQHGGAA